MVQHSSRICDALPTILQVFTIAISLLLQRLKNLGSSRFTFDKLTVREIAFTNRTNPKCFGHDRFSIET
jgi:hypothetical protein